MCIVSLRTLHFTSEPCKRSTIVENSILYITSTWEKVSVHIWYQLQRKNSTEYSLAASNRFYIVIIIRLFSTIQIGFLLEFDTLFPTVQLKNRIRWQSRKKKKISFSSNIVTISGKRLFSLSVNICKVAHLVELRFLYPILYLNVIFSLRDHINKRWL